MNTATACGYTPQLESLEALSRAARRRPRRARLPGQPGQEPRSNAEIAEFCKANYGVTFPMFATSAVTGEHANPLFRRLAKAAGAPEWNFNKYLVDRRGKVVARFGAGAEPDGRSRLGGSRRCCDAAANVCSGSCGRTNTSANAGRHRRAIRAGLATEPSKSAGLPPSRPQPGCRPRGPLRRPARPRPYQDLTRLIRDGRYQVTIATKGGNQSWNGLVKRFSPDRCDYLFVSGMIAAMVHPVGVRHGAVGTGFGGPKYAAYEVDRGRPILAARPLIARLPRPRRGSRAVKRVAL